MQPGRHRRPGPAGRRRPAVGAARVRDQGLGAGRRPRLRAGAGGAADAGPYTGGARRRPLHRRTAARSARCDAARAGRRRRAGALAQSGTRHPGVVLRPARGGERAPATRPRYEPCRRARRRPRRVQGVGARPRAVQHGAVRRGADGRGVPDEPSHRRPGPEGDQGPRPGDDERDRPAHRALHRHRPGGQGSGTAEHLRRARQAAEPHHVPARQVRRAGAHPGGEPRDDDRRVLRDAAVPGTVDHRRGCSRGGARRPSTCGCWCRSG